jgi:tRNA (cmo5U34)-methyltransferase
MAESRFQSVGGEDYDLLIASIPYYEDMQNQVGSAVARHFGPKKMAILDLGTGTGATAKAILDANPACIVYAIDNEPSMIPSAKANLMKYGGRVVVAEESAKDYLSATPDRSYDAVVSGLMLHNLELIERLYIIEGIFHVLKPGGLFVNADKYALDDPKEFRKTLDWQIEQYKRVFSESGRPDLLEEWIRHEEHDMRPDAIMNQGEALKQMAEAGFSNIEIIFRRQMHAVLVAEKH